MFFLEESLAFSDLLFPLHSSNMKREASCMDMTKSGSHATLLDADALRASSSGIQAVQIGNVQSLLLASPNMPAELRAKTTWSLEVSQQLLAPSIHP